MSVNLCIIPARGGSKRIPKKNSKVFFGKPIIAYSIETALKSGLFDEVMVSTDSDEIALIAGKYGAKTPFKRSDKNADDYATTMDVIQEVIATYTDLNRHFNRVCCLYPCAPFVTSVDLKKAYDLMISENFDSVCTLVEYGHPIQRAIQIVDSGRIEMIQPENKNIRSQDLTKSFHDGGQFYWFNSTKLIKKNTVFTENTGAIVIEANRIQDIDTLVDWKLAELKYSLLQDETNV